MEYAARVQCPVGCVLDQGLFRENAVVSNAMNRMAQQFPPSPPPSSSSKTVVIVLVVVCIVCVLCSVGAAAVAYMYRDKVAESMGYDTVDEMYEKLGLSFLVKQDE